MYYIINLLKCGQCLKVAICCFLAPSSSSAARSRRTCPRSARRPRPGPARGPARAWGGGSPAGTARGWAAGTRAQTSSQLELTRAN